MAGVNKVIIIGNLGNDPEVRYSANGSAIANISVATSESWTDKNSGDKQEKTEWHRIVMFNRCLLYTSPSPRDKRQSRMPSSA